MWNKPEFWFELLKGALVPVSLALYAYWCKRRDDKRKDDREEEDKLSAAKLALEEAKLKMLSGNTDAAMQIYKDIIERLTNELKDAKSEVDRYRKERDECEDEKGECDVASN